MARRNGGKGLGLLIAIFFALAAAALALPFLGTRNAVRGYERTLVETIFLTIMPNLAMVVIGVVLGAYTLPVFFGQNDAAVETTFPNYEIGLGAAVLAAIAGGLVGLTQRAGRLEAIAVSKDNATFLQSAGIRVTGLEDVTHYDVGNNPLRYMETVGNQQIFMAVGRRNKRAYIEIDRNGRMLRYSGIISL